MSGLLAYWLVLIGLAGLVPGPTFRPGDWLGLRAFTAFAGLVMMLFFGSVVLGLTPVLVARGIAAAAAAGLAAQAFRRAVPDLGHPVVVFPAVMAAIVAWRGGLNYQPLAWDELGGWLQWIRNISLGGAATEASNSYAKQGYTPGWPFAAAFPNLLLGGFSEGRSAVTPFLMHTALLGVVYDVMAHRLRLGGWPMFSSRLAAWGLILVALAVEASWRLAPTNLLIEKPQIYSIAACCLLSLALADRDIRILRLSFAMGMAFALGYLVKVSMLAFAGPYLLLFAAPLWLRRHSTGLSNGQALRAAVLAVLPTIAVYVSWKVLGPAAVSCLANPLAVVEGIVQGDGSSLPRALDLAGRFLAAEGDYLWSFKLPLTLLSLAGLAAAAGSPVLRALPLALVLYCCLYFGALYAYHLTCLGEFYFRELNSIDRFTRVPLRVIHLCGLVVPVLVLAPRLARLAEKSAIRAGVLVVVALLGLWQGRRLYESVDVMATRRDADPSQVATVLAVKASAASVAAAVAGDPALGRRVLIIAQGSDAYEHTIADYYSARAFSLHDTVSWGETPVNAFMRRTTSSSMTETLLGASLIWPIRADGWMIGVLSGLVHDPHCLAHVGDYFLVPDMTARILTCRPMERPE